MLETMIILMYTCGEPEVLYMQGGEEINIAAYGKINVDQESDKRFHELCSGNARAGAKIQIWHLDKLNSRQCRTKVKL